ncbi:MAG: tRNA (adenosine(37)-N6)-threonylcarbamoyltransferase complex dimerization subunit type 1 TsaB [Pseudomonadota bacterium]
MTTLILDTALHCAQAALFENDVCLAQASQTGERGQAEVLLPVLEDVLKKAQRSWRDVQKIIVTVGPGVFTGIRSGIAAARAVRMAQNVELVGISTLQLLAASAADKNKSVLAVIDAHKSEAYAQLFSSDLKPQGAPMLVRLEALPPVFKEAGQIVVYPALFAQALAEYKNVQPVKALDLEKAVICAEAQPLDAVPLYIRAPDALPQQGALLKRA